MGAFCKEVPHGSGREEEDRHNSREQREEDGQVPRVFQPTPPETLCSPQEDGVVGERHLDDAEGFREREGHGEDEESGQCPVDQIRPSLASR